jgi:hypothetical protein
VSEASLLVVEHDPVVEAERRVLVQPTLSFRGRLGGRARHAGPDALVDARPPVRCAVPPDGKLEVTRPIRTAFIVRRKRKRRGLRADLQGEVRQLGGDVEDAVVR